MLIKSLSNSNNFLREKSKRYAEQGAAMVSLHALQLVEKEYGFVPAKGTRKYQHLFNPDNKKDLKRTDNENNILHVKKQCINKV